MLIEEQEIYVAETSRGFLMKPPAESFRKIIGRPKEVSDCV